MSGAYGRFVVEQVCFLEKLLAETCPLTLTICESVGPRSTTKRQWERERERERERVIEEHIYWNTERPYNFQTSDPNKSSSLL